MANQTTNPKAITPAVQEAELKSLDAGVVAELPSTVSFTIEGTALTQAEIDGKLRGYLAAFKAVEMARAQLEAAVAARLAITVEARTFAKALKPIIKSYFGSKSATLAKFAIPTDKPLETTAQQKLVAAAKRTQTRTVHGIKGKKQRAALTVVGNPPIHVPSTGALTIGPPPINLAAAVGPTVGSPTPASASSDPRNGTSGGSTLPGA